MRQKSGDRRAQPEPRVIRIADAGHILWIDDPYRVVGEIQRFVARSS